MSYSVIIQVNLLQNVYLNVSETLGMADVFLLSVMVACLLMISYCVPAYIYI